MSKQQGLGQDNWSARQRLPTPHDDKMLKINEMFSQKGKLEPLGEPVFFGKNYMKLKKSGLNKRDKRIALGVEVFLDEIDEVIDVKSIAVNKCLVRLKQAEERIDVDGEFALVNIRELEKKLDLEILEFSKVLISSFVSGVGNLFDARGGRVVVRREDVIKELFSAEFISGERDDFTEGDEYQRKNWEAVFSSKLYDGCKIWAVDGNYKILRDAFRELYRAINYSCLDVNGELLGKKEDRLDAFAKVRVAADFSACFGGEVGQLSDICDNRIKDRESLYDAVEKVVVKKILPFCGGVGNEIHVRQWLKFALSGKNPGDDKIFYPAGWMGQIDIKRLFEILMVKNGELILGSCLGEIKGIFEDINEQIVGGFLRKKNRLREVQGQIQRITSARDAVEDLSEDYDSKFALEALRGEEEQLQIDLKREREELEGDVIEDNGYFFVDEFCAKIFEAFEEKQKDCDNYFVKKISMQEFSEIWKDFNGFYLGRVTAAETDKKINDLLVSVLSRGENVEGLNWREVNKEKLECVFVLNSFLLRNHDVPIWLRNFAASVFGVEAIGDISFDQVNCANFERALIKEMTKFCDEVSDKFKIPLRVACEYDSENKVVDTRFGRYFGPTAGDQFEWQDFEDALNAGCEPDFICYVFGFLVNDQGAELIIGQISAKPLILHPWQKQIIEKIREISTDNNVFDFFSESELLENIVYSGDLNFARHLNLKELQVVFWDYFGRYRDARNSEVFSLNEIRLILDNFCEKSSTEEERVQAVDAMCEIFTNPVVFRYENNYYETTFFNSLVWCHNPKRYENFNWLFSKLDADVLCNLVFLQEGYDSIDFLEVLTYINDSDSKDAIHAFFDKALGSSEFTDRFIKHMRSYDSCYPEDVRESVANLLSLSYEVYANVGQYDSAIEFFKIASWQQDFYDQALLNFASASESNKIGFLEVEAYCFMLEDIDDDEMEHRSPKEVCERYIEFNKKVLAEKSKTINILAVAVRRTRDDFSSLDPGLTDEEIDVKVKAVVESDLQLRQIAISQESLENDVSMAATGITRVQAVLDEIGAREGRSGTAEQPGDFFEPQETVVMSQEELGVEGRQC